MTIIICFFSGLFFFIAVALIFAYYRIRHAGLILLSVAYWSAAAGAMLLMHWWPLVVGYASVWVLKYLGCDPGVQNTPPPQGDGGA